jgi:hypothetical protein
VARIGTIRLVTVDGIIGVITVNDAAGFDDITFISYSCSPAKTGLVPANRTAGHGKKGYTSCNPHPAGITGFHVGVREFVDKAAEIRFGDFLPGTINTGSSVTDIIGSYR